MKNIENCIQLKIDQLIANLNLKKGSKNVQQDEFNELTALIAYNHCLDLFDFLQKYSKVQKTELIFRISVIYDILGYKKFSLDYINQALLLIPNSPTIILYKSCLNASINKLDEAQKYLIKYKYLIGEDMNGNYIYNTIRILYFYLLEYEENIILREINIIENKYQNYYNGNFLLFLIKSKIFDNLSKKNEKNDKIRSKIYQKECLKNKDKAFSINKHNADYLYNIGIYKEMTSNILIMINPNIIEYKPKTLLNYKNDFHTGFEMFFILFKIAKLFKLKIEIIKLKKICKSKKYLKNKQKENICFNNILNIIRNERNIAENSTHRELFESIINLTKNPFLENYINNNKNNIKTENRNNSILRKPNQKNPIKLKQNEIKLSKNSNSDKINDKIQINYYIYKGFYSKLNLKDSIIININYNNEYKKKILGKDSLFDDGKSDFNNNTKKNKSNDDIILDFNKIYFKKNENKIMKKREINKIKLIKSTQNNFYFNSNKSNKLKKEKIIKININEKDDSPKNLNNKKSVVQYNEKAKKIKINEAIENKNHIINRISKFSKRNKGSFKKLINSNTFHKEDEQNDEKKNVNKFKNKEYKKNNIYFLTFHKNEANNNNKKALAKSTKNSNRKNNIFNNISIFDSNNKYSCRNTIKKYININHKSNEKSKINREITINNINKDKELSVVNEIEKNQEINNDINYKINNNKNNKDNNIYNINYNICPNNKTKNSNKNINNTENADKMEYFRKVSIKKRVKSNRKSIYIEKISRTQKLSHKNFDIISYKKSTFINKEKNKNLTKFNSQNSKKSLVNKKELTLDNCSLKKISIKEFSQKRINKKSNMNYIDIKNNKMRAHTENIHGKKKSRVKSRKRIDFLNKEKYCYLSINNYLISHSKMILPKYQKSSLFCSFRSNSKEKKENFNKIGKSNFY